MTVRLRERLASLSLPDLGVIAIVLVMACLVVLLGEDPDQGLDARSLDALAAAIFLSAVAALLLCTRFPASVAIAELGLSMLWYTLGYSSRLIDAPALVAFFAVGTTGDRVRQLGVGGFAVLGLLIGALPFTGTSIRIAFAGIGWITAALLFGELVHNRRLLLEQYAERAAKAEANRDAEAERRVADERLRIARDVHDVLAHTVSVMTVQAGVAADAAGHDASAVRLALDRVRAAGREAMSEIRATVAVLRGTRPTETTPTPGLDRVVELAEGARAQGLEVDVSIDIDGADLERLVQLTAYRIVQESLTNVIRHAGASRARVWIARSGPKLLVEIRDDGVSSSSSLVPVPGYGLRGMGERIESVGGTLSYGPAPEGGWAVVAQVPTKAVAP